MVMKIMIRMVTVMRACLVAEMASSLISLSLPQLHLAPPFQYVSVGHNGRGKGTFFNRLVYKLQIYIAKWCNV